MTDGIYRKLRDEIYAGALASGARLSVPAIARRFDVSRSPVRDAVLRLVEERLAQAQPHRGAIVAQVGLSELAALYEVREVLEGLAARLAVENAGQRFVQALKRALHDHEQVVATGAVERHMDSDMHFHSLIRGASGNSVLIHDLDNIQTQIRLAMHTTVLTAGPLKALDDHRAILAAIDRGDPLGAEVAARQHIARLQRALIDRLEDEAAAGGS